MPGRVLDKVRSPMDADKWDDYYRRTKDKDGTEEAMSGLVSGMLRELKSRMERKKPWEDPSEVAEDVDDIYREVASRHRELSEDGFVRFIEETAPPEITQLFENL